MTHKIGDTLRTKCGFGRITYHPDWSESKPWATYRHGTAGLHLADPQEAVAYFKKYGMIFEVPGEKQIPG